MEQTKALQLVSIALKLDSEHKDKAAYKAYMHGISYIANVLLEDCEFALDVNLTGCLPHLKLLSLVSQCVDRANTILKGDNFNCSSTPFHSEQPRSSSPNLLQGEDTDVNDVTVGEEPDSFVESLMDAPITDISRFTPSFEDDEREFSWKQVAEANKRNTRLIQSYKYRMNMARDRHAKTSLALELQRRVSENLRIAHAREEELIGSRLRKQLQLQEDAEKKVNEILLENHEKKELCSKILRFEQTCPHLSALRLQLVNNNVESGLVGEIVRVCLTTDDHPLRKLLNEYQSNIQSDLNSVLQQIKSNTIDTDGTDYNTDDFLFKDGSTSPITENILENGKADRPTTVNSETAESTDIELKPVERKTSIAFKAICENSKSCIIDLYDVLMLIYEPFKQSVNLTGKQVYSSVDSQFFTKDIWSDMQELAGVVLQNELLDLDRATMRLASLDTWKFGIPENLASETLIQIYKQAAVELSKTEGLGSPCAVLSCMVASVKFICRDGEFFVSRFSSIGADELLPILTYVIVESGCARQLLVISHIVEMLINDNFVLGKEGYCLTSVQTAFQFMKELPTAKPNLDE